MAEDKKDKRRFRRYRKKLDFDLLIKNKSFRAMTFDYSLGGIGAMIEDSPPINVGDILEVNIPHSSLKFSGKVVRSEKLRGGLRVGINRTSPIRGTLKDFHLHDVLLGLQRSAKTGTLNITMGPVLKSIYINGGDIIFASSNHTEDNPPALLLKEGRITQRQYEESAETAKKTGKRHGAVLVGMGYLKPQELIEAVKHSAEHIIFSLFGSDEGILEFMEGPLPVNEVINLKLPTASLIYHGIKGLNDSDYIRANSPSLDSVLGFSSDPLNLFQDIRLSDEDRRLLFYLDGKTSIKDIISLSHRNEAEVLKTLYAVLCTRMIEVEESMAKSAEVSVEEVLSEQKPEVPTEMARQIEEMYQNHEGLGYYSILGVKNTAGNPEIKRAFHRMARQFHPDKHFLLPAEIKGKLNSIFTYITTAYTTLTHPGKRKDYDMSLLIKPAKLGSAVEVAAEKFKEGTAALKQGRLEDASRLFAEAAYHDVSIANYHYHCAITLYRLGKLRDAERAIQRALRLDPFNADCLAEAGHIYLDMNLSLRAKAHFDKAIGVQASNQRANEGLNRLKDN